MNDNDHNNGPWGPWNGENQNKENSDKKNDGSRKQGYEKNFENKKRQAKNLPQTIEEFFKNIEDFFRKKISEPKKPQNNEKLPKSSFGLIILGAVLFWLLLGLYKVDSDENAVVLYFGKFHSISTPGLNYHIPYPFGQVIKKSVTTVNSEEFGFSSSSGKLSKRNFDAESLMLTGDENIVDIEFQVQWQIADIKNFVFNIAEPNQAIRKSAESAMREIIARSPISDALSDGKSKIEQDAKTLLQQILDSYEAGVKITLVQLRRVDPPAQVIDAFRDVQTAKADKEKEINEAQAYANDIVPRARGSASQIKEQSEAYAKEVVVKAEGEAGRFLSVYNQYLKAKQVTKKRIYLETMEGVYRDMDKIIVSSGAGKSGIIPYFPLSDLSQNRSEIKTNK